MSLLVADRLRKAYGGIEAVNDVSFAVEAGEVVALIGPNGAGKSTCFNVLNGQVRPDSGRVMLHGADITARSPAAISRLGVGRGFQVAATFGSMTVRENVQMALIARHQETWRFVTPAAVRHREAADGLLRQVGLFEQAESGCGTLAYGDLKRLEVALALANEPRLLLMDEPTAGLPPADRRTLIGLVRALARSGDRAVLFTEHDMDVVFAAADRILVMDHGRLIAQGPPAAIRADPTVRAVYLGEA